MMEWFDDGRGYSTADGASQSLSQTWEGAFCEGRECPWKYADQRSQLNHARRRRVCVGRRQRARMAFAIRVSKPRCQILRKILRRYIQSRIDQKTMSTPMPRSTGWNGAPRIMNGAVPRCRTRADAMKCSIVQLMT
jgi:hypothetical protein